MVFLVACVIAFVVAVLLKNNGYTREAEPNAALGGVCAGFARRFDINPTAIRVLWVIASLTLGCGLIAYTALWLVLPVRAD